MKTSPRTTPIPPSIIAELTELIRHGLDRIVSPKCYGYLMLSACQEEHLEEAFDLSDEDWERTERM